MYRPTSDIHTLLSEALWKIKNSKVGRSEVKDEHVAPAPDMIDTISIGHMNRLIHTQIESSVGQGQDYDELNVDEQITKVDPYLWNALCSITRSKSEICGRSKVDDPTSQVHHLKRIRCFFLLCVIMFITDDRCSVPMHTLLTDMVESQGGSSVLVRTLNRLGVCSSADTLARFIQHKRSACEYPCIKHLTKDAFTVVSADNSLLSSCLVQLLITAMLTWMISLILHTYIAHTRRLYIHIYSRNKEHLLSHNSGTQHVVYTKSYNNQTYIYTSLNLPKMHAKMSAAR